VFCILAGFDAQFEKKFEALSVRMSNLSNELVRIPFRHFGPWIPSETFFTLDNVGNF